MYTALKWSEGGVLNANGIGSVASGAGPTKLKQWLQDPVKFNRCMVGAGVWPTKLHVPFVFCASRVS